MLLDCVREPPNRVLGQVNLVFDAEAMKSFLNWMQMSKIIAALFYEWNKPP